MKVTNHSGEGVEKSLLYVTRALNKKTSAVRSRISSKLIFASCVGYFDRAYSGFYVTSSTMLLIVLIERDNI